MVRDPQTARLIQDLTGRLRAEDLAAAGPLAARLAGLLPDDPEALQLRAILAIKESRPDAAAALLRRAIVLAPQHAALYANLATAQRAAGALSEAAGNLRRAVRILPNSAELHFNLGNLLEQAGERMQALPSFRRALVLAPGSDRILFNLGNLHQALFEMERAAPLLERAARLDGGMRIEALVNLGRVLEALGRHGQAAACYDQVVAAKPDHVYGNWNRALLRLRRGDLAGGFRDYEWRWRLADHPPRQLGRPAWRGEPLAGRTVLIHAEQGLGDSIQFCRYLPLAAARGGRVVFECQPPLLRLMRLSFPDIQVVAAGEALPAFDVHAPLMSLPLLLGTRSLADIPAGIPYLRAPPPPPLHGTGLRIGLVWAGSPGHNLQPIQHIVPLDALAPLLGIPGVSAFSLQKGPAGADLAGRGDLAIHDLGPALSDFADTAAHVMALDLVVTMDTSVAHLAGALGRPVCILLRAAPDWRWLLDRSDSPWYPTATLFRQRRLGDWRPVVEAVAEHVRRVVQGGASRGEDQP